MPHLSPLYRAVFKPKVAAAHHPLASTVNELNFLFELDDVGCEALYSLCYYIIVDHRVMLRALVRLKYQK